MYSQTNSSVADFNICHKLCWLHSDYYSKILFMKSAVYSLSPRGKHEELYTCEGRLKIETCTFRVW